jgi:hypothetical protein
MACYLVPYDIGEENQMAGVSPYRVLVLSSAHAEHFALC